MKIGDVLDGRFRIDDLCSNEGGMGTIYHVTDLDSKGSSMPLVAKICKHTDPQIRTRFKREVRLLSNFEGNSRVVQMTHFNIKCSPPYFVMKFYSEGDLESNRSKFETRPDRMEKVFLQMIDCVNELHIKGIFHRDLKPQNFLFERGKIAVSDMGLSVEAVSPTRITSMNASGGTLGYSPPEAFGNFRNPDAAFDIFMLGKSFYYLATGRDPQFMSNGSISPGLYNLIQRACKLEKRHRFQSLAELKQAMVAVFDIILDRVEGLHDAKNRLLVILAQLTNEKVYDADEVNEFLEALLTLKADDQDIVCQLLKPEFFSVIAQDSFDSKRGAFLVAWGQMVRNGNYGWPFAENIADCAKSIFKSGNPTPEEKALVLELAIHAAQTKSRFAAMNTITELISSVKERELAEHVNGVILNCADTFVSEIEPSNCSHDIVARAIKTLKEAENEDE